LLHYQAGFVLRQMKLMKSTFPFLAVLLLVVARVLPLALHEGEIDLLDPHGRHTDGKILAVPRPAHPRLSPRKSSPLPVETPWLLCP